MYLFERRHHVFQDDFELWTPNPPASTSGVLGLQTGIKPSPWSTGDRVQCRACWASALITDLHSQPRFYNSLLCPAFLRLLQPPRRFAAYEWDYILIVAVPFLRLDFQTQMSSLWGGRGEHCYSWNRTHDRREERDLGACLWPGFKV